MKTLYVLLHFLFFDNIIDWSQIRTLFSEKIDKYSELLFGMLIGVLVLYLYHRFVGNRLQKKSYERMIEQLESNIAGYQNILSDRFDKVQVAEADRAFFRKIRRYFKNHVTHK